MSPDFHRELLGLSEADAQVALRVAMSRIGSNEHPVPKVRTLQTLLLDMLQTGWSEKSSVVQVLREMRADIDLRLERMQVETAEPVCTCNGGDLPLFDHHRMCDLREGVTA